MTDWTRYVGIPNRAHGRDRSGVDCWGLVRLVFQEERGIRLPSYVGQCPALDEREDLARLITSERDVGPWREVDRAQPFDVLLFRVGAHETHVGLAVDAKNMLHSFGGAGSVIERMDGPRWRKRLVGVYRYCGATSVQVISTPGLLPEQARRMFDVVPTATVEEIIQAALPGVTESAYPYLRVLLMQGKDVIAIPQRMWARVRPHPGTTVAVRVVPGDPGTIAGFLTAQFINLTGIASLGVLQGVYAASFALVTIGVSALTSAALNALVPVPDAPDGPRNPETRYSLRGWQNQATPGDPVPNPFGQIRVAPPFAALPYQEIVNGDQYVRALFCFGYGRLDISDLRIGETSVDEFDDIEVEIREGLDTDDPVTITPIQVFEQADQVELIYPWPKDADGNDITSGSRVEQPIIRTTASQAVRAGVIFSFPSGLYWFKDEKAQNQGMDIRIRHRLKGDVSWIDVTTLRYVSKKNQAFFRQFTWDLPTRGTWEVEVTRLTPMYDDNPQRSARVFLSAFQSYRPEYPIALDTPLALCAIKVRASYQLQGALDSVNALVTRYAKDWNGTAWVSAQTRNPASAFILALQGPDNPFPALDAEIDFERLAEWHYFCEARNLHYDREQRSSESLLARLRLICAAGRATPWHDGTKWSVVIDSPALAVSGNTAGTVGADPGRIVAHISPRNSYNFSGSRSYLETPDAVRVRFRDETEDYAEAEVFIPWPGKSAPYDVVEQWDLPGKTNPTEIQREAYRLMQIAELRRDRWTVEQSDEFRVVTRGDAVRLSHYVLSDVQFTGRVVAVDGALVVLDEAVVMQAGTTYVLQYIATTELDPVGTSVLTTVATVEGTTRTLNVTGATVPAEGDLVLFGPADEAAFDALVLDIEPGQDFASTITLTNLAPEIDTLTDAFVPEAWDPIVGEVVDVGLDPGAPVFAGVFTSAAEGAYGTDARTLEVTLTSAADERALIAGFELDHRLTGAMTWTTVSLVGGQPTAELSYDQGDSVELRARAEDFDGDFGPYTSTTTFVVGSDLGTLPAAVDLGALTITGGLLGRTEFTLAHSDPATTAIQIFRTADGDTFDSATDALGDPVPVSAGTPVSYADGDATRAHILTATYTNGGGWGSATLPSTHTPGSASTLSQAFAFEVRTYRGQITISGRTAGSVTVQFTGGSTVATSAISANGQALFTLDALSGNTTFEVVATSDFDGTVDSISLYRDTDACAPQGIFEYRFAAINVDEIGSAVSAETTVTII